VLQLVDCTVMQKRQYCSLPPCTQQVCRVYQAASEQRATTGVWHTCTGQHSPPSMPTHHSHLHAHLVHDAVGVPVEVVDVEPHFLLVSS
jgi:hypothetical protein